MRMIGGQCQVMYVAKQQRSQSLNEAAPCTPEPSGTVALVEHSQGGQAALLAAHHKDRIPEPDVCAVPAIARPSQLKTLLLNGALAQTRSRVAPSPRCS